MPLLLAPRPDLLHRTTEHVLLAGLPVHDARGGKGEGEEEGDNRSALAKGCNRPFSCGCGPSKLGGPAKKMCPSF